MAKLTIEEFDAAVAAFVATQDDVYANRWYCTSRHIAAEKLADFREFLYGDALAKEKRHKQWLELNKEFGGG